MTGFSETLKAIAARVPETQVLMVMGTDGIPIDKLVLRPDPNLEAVAAECTTLLRASLAAAADTGLGELKELSIVTEKMVALLHHPRVLPVRGPGPGRPHRPRPLRPARRRPEPGARVRLRDVRRFLDTLQAPAE